MAKPTRDRALHPSGGTTSSHSPSVAIMREMLGHMYPNLRGST